MLEAGVEGLKLENVTPLQAPQEESHQSPQIQIPSPQPSITSHHGQSLERSLDCSIDASIEKSMEESLERSREKIRERRRGKSLEKSLERRVDRSISHCRGGLNSRDVSLSQDRFSEVVF